MTVWAYPETAGSKTVVPAVIIHAETREDAVDLLRAELQQRGIAEEVHEALMMEFPGTPHEVIRFLSGEDAD